MMKKTRSVFLKTFCLLLILFLSRFSMLAQPYNFYYGNIHAHSGYSDGNMDSVATQYHSPAEDYGYAEASAHFDFLGISDHNHSSAGMSLGHFHMGVNEAAAAEQPGVFAAFYGMEYGVINNGGHVLVYGIDSLIGWQSGNYDIYCGQYNYTQLFSIVNAHAGAFCSLAHPNSADYGDLANTAYNTAADNAISGTCVRNGSAFSTTTDYSDPPATLYETYFKTMLGKGYHLGPSIDHDNHNTTFGRTLPGRTVVLANALSKTDILDGLRNMRYYASDDWNAEVNYTINGLYMGTVADISDNPTLSVSVTDPDGENVSKIQVYYGVPGSGAQPTVLTTVNNSNTLTYTHSINIDNTYYYYLKIQQTDGHLIWTAPIWVHKVSAPLPLELETFRATALKDRVQVEWKAYVRVPGIFWLERSTDGVHFENLAQLPATPQPGAQSYAFDDLDPLEGLAFYRLREVDADGSAEYSPIISVSWKNPDLTLVTAGPNPAAGHFTVFFQSKKEEAYTFFLYNEDGREIRRQAFAVRHGENELRLDTESLSPGVYYLILGKPGKRMLEMKVVKG